MKYFFAVLLLFLSLLGHAGEIQILHSNDIHSFIEHNQQDPNQGGYPRLKFQMDQLSDQAAQEGIPSIRTDGGDFLEGNFFYMAKEGQRVLQIHDAMKYDVVALGNHDYMMGTKQLEKLLSKEDFSFSLLAANLKVLDKSKNKTLQQKIQPTRVLTIDGKKIGFIGLTAKELPYNWALESDNIKVLSPFKTANFYAKKLKKEGVDLIIVLSHLGLKKDEALAYQSKYIDLILGSHSHDTLEEARLVKNSLGNEIPIIQSEPHGSKFARLIIDPNNKQGEQLKSYQLVDVNSLEQDQKMKRLVQQAKEDLYQKYGKEWLEEVVGHYYARDVDEIDRDRVLSRFIANAMKNEIGSDAAIHSPNFVEGKFLSENITRLDLFNLNPRIYALDEPFGPKVFQLRINGLLLHLIDRLSKSHNLPITIAGAENIRVKNFFKVYDVAIPAGVFNALSRTSRLSRMMLRKFKAKASCSTLVQALTNSFQMMDPEKF